MHAKHERVAFGADANSCSQHVITRILDTIEYLEVSDILSQRAEQATSRGWMLYGGMQVFHALLQDSFIPELWDDKLSDTWRLPRRLQSNCHTEGGREIRDSRQWTQHTIGYPL